MRKVILLSASFLFLFTACKKEGELSPEFASDTSSNSFTNDIDISVRILPGDSVLADRITTGLVGFYKDSVFGTSNISTNVQAVLPSNSLVFGNTGETLSTDSVVLSLDYNGIYGDTVAQKLQVYRITEELSTEEEYPSNYAVQTEAVPLGSKTFVPKVFEDIYVLRPDANGNLDSIRLDPQLRIRLDNSLGDEILDQSGKDPVSNTSQFVQFFKGLRISPDTSVTLTNNEKAILYFALTSSNTKMSIFYTATDGQGNATKKVIDFPVNSTSVRFNSFSHDYSLGSVNNALQNGTDSNYLYIQAMAGVRSLIQFPGLQPLIGSRITVNKAELELPVVDDSYAAFGFPDKLVIAVQSEDGDLQFIPDFFEGASYFGGDYDFASKTYKFNISRYIQGLINETETRKELSLLVSGSAVKADRVVLHGPKGLNQRLKLNLYYSKTQ